MPVVDDARIGCRELAANVLRRVGGCVVGDNELEVLVRLGEHGSDDDRKPLRSITDRKTDGDKRVRRSASAAWVLRVHGRCYRGF